MIIREYINFERGSNPKKAMNIGMEAQIENFMEEFSNESRNNWLSDLIQNDFEEMGLNPDKQGIWIKHLLKNPEFNKNLDENDYYAMREKGIQWIPDVPFHPSAGMSYELLGDQYFITFHEWTDFIDFIDTSNLRDRVSEEFLRAVLSGDAFKFFEMDSDYANDITEFTWLLKKIESKGNGLDVLKDIKDKAIELGGDPDNMENLESLMEEINDNKDLDDLKDAISHAVMEAQEIADENEAYKHIIDEIKKYFEIGEGNWIDENTYKAKITKKGVEMISYTIVTGDEKLGYSAPYNGYSGSISEDELLDSIDNKLNDL